MPKNQSSAAKRARAAARDGAKYTTVLRNTSLPVPDPASPGWDELVVAALSAVVAERGTVPATEVWDESARHSMVQREGGTYGGVRWGVVEPAADGIVIREVRDCTGVVPKGTRVPVPYRLHDGRVEVAALWPVVWSSNAQPFWRYVHNGWSVENPGDLPASLAPFRPSENLQYEVRTYSVPDGIVGEDHTGGAPSWGTNAWCERLDQAVLLADALVAHRLSTPSRPAGGDCGNLRAEVWAHTTANQTEPPVRVHQVDADPNRPVVPRVPYDTWLPGRPDSAAPIPEPAWYPDEKHPPNYSLTVWSESNGWETIAWFVGGRSPAGIAATLLRVGTGGPYAYAETWGPDYPDAWRQDFTQEGRAIMDRHPDEAFAETTARYDRQRRQETADLAAALAARSRGALTVEQAAARLQTGGQAYRDFLRIGQICIVDALEEKRLAAEEGSEERMRMRAALDALEERHQAEEWVVELTAEHMATRRRDAHYTDGAKAYRVRALKEYLSPGEDVAGVPGLAA
ncbi:hypothetical protein [Streptomyces sp. NPDC088915]|uniref:hypothetical protein n=1 Tax=Streptomyces sp. NPDC088915 TaxID=3365912 RepID=UPI00382A38C9